MIKDLRKGGFIVLEGIDGCGKSTCTKLVVGELRALGYDVVATRQLGGTPKAEAIRKRILEENLSPCEQARLAIEAIHDCYINVILPAIKEGKVVVSDRYYQSALVYNGRMHSQEAEVQKHIDNLFGNDQVYPDYIFYLQASVSTTVDRMKAKLVRDSMDSIDPEHHMRLNQHYNRVICNILDNRSSKVQLICTDNGVSGEPNDVSKNIRSIIKRIASNIFWF